MFLSRPYNQDRWVFSWERDCRVGSILVIIFLKRDSYCSVTVSQLYFCFATSCARFANASVSAGDCISWVNGSFLFPPPRLERGLAWRNSLSVLSSPCPMMPSAFYLDTHNSHSTITESQPRPWFCQRFQAPTGSFTKGLPERLWFLASGFISPQANEHEVNAFQVANRGSYNLVQQREFNGVRLWMFQRNVPQSH